MAETPTYYTTQERDGTDVFHCLVCATQQQEHHSADPQLFAQHMAQRHDGRMVSTPGGQKPEEPAEAQGEETQAEETHEPETVPAEEGNHVEEQPDMAEVPTAVAPQPSPTTPPTPPPTAPETPEPQPPEEEV